jgi:hypothetical protein
MRPILLLVSSLRLAGCATGSDWLILVNEQVVVDATTLAARRSEFEAALDGVDGMYDGWEAAAEP